MIFQLNLEFVLCQRCCAGSDCFVLTSCSCFLVSKFLQDWSICEAKQSLTSQRMCRGIIITVT